jgi:hypothetical protein
MQWHPSTGAMKSPLVIVAWAAELGVVTNKKKYHPFGEQQKCIGFIWNMKDKTVTLALHKLTLRLEALNFFLEEDCRFRYKQVEVLVGQLNCVSYLLPQMKCKLCSLYWMLKACVHLDVIRPIPNNIGCDLEQWAYVLMSYSSTRLIPDTTPVDVGWSGDASLKYGVGVFIGKKWACYKILPGWRTGKHGSRDINWAETVAIFLGLIMLLRLGVTPGVVFQT